MEMIMLSKDVEDLFDFQKAFQFKVSDTDVTELDFSARLALAEGFVFKAIEECVELRKTFPSSLNKVEKHPGQCDKAEVKRELSDVFIFLINFMLVMHISPEDLLETLVEVQLNNLAKLEAKQKNV